jgi:hypothetical protein
MDWMSWTDLRSPWGDVMEARSMSLYWGCGVKPPVESSDSGVRWSQKGGSGVVAVAVVVVVGTELVSISEVKQRRARLVLEWVTVQRLTSH